MIMSIYIGIILICGYLITPKIYFLLLGLVCFFISAACHGSLVDRVKKLEEQIKDGGIK